MASHKRVYNESKQIWMKFRQAEKAVEACSAIWVIYGQKTRNLTIAEAIEARNTQAKNREPLPWAEIPGLKFKPTESGMTAHREGIRTAWKANELAQA